MSSFQCPECGKNIIDTLNGYVTGCEHYPIEDFTELSGKHMSDGKDQAEADLMAFQQMIKQGRLL